MPKRLESSPKGLGLINKGLGFTHSLFKLTNLRLAFTQKLTTLLDASNNALRRHEKGKRIHITGSSSQIDLESQAGKELSLGTVSASVELWAVLVRPFEVLESENAGQAETTRQSAMLSGL